jgi:hypothetical protein
MTPALVDIIPLSPSSTILLLLLLNITAVDRLHCL